MSALDTSGPATPEGPLVHALAAGLTGIDDDLWQVALAAAAHHWLVNRHQLAAALSDLDQPTVGEILAILQGDTAS